MITNNKFWQQQGSNHLLRPVKTILLNRWCLSLLGHCGTACSQIQQGLKLCGPLTDKQFWIGPTIFLDTRILKRFVVNFFQIFEVCIFCASFTRILHRFFGYFREPKTVQLQALLYLIVTILTKLYFFSDSKGIRHFLPPTFWCQFGRWCDNRNVFQPEIHGTNSPRGLHSLEPSAIGWILLHLLRYEQVSQNIFGLDQNFLDQTKIYFGLGPNLFWSL